MNELLNRVEQMLENGFDIEDIYLLMDCAGYSAEDVELALWLNLGD